MTGESTRVVATAVLSANAIPGTTSDIWALPEHQAIEVRDWLTANGIDPHRVTWAKPEVMDTGVIRFAVIDIEAYDGGLELPERVQIGVMRVPPPTWWLWRPATERAS